jgi:hypothetical protein
LFATPAGYLPGSPFPLHVSSLLYSNYLAQVFRSQFWGSICSSDYSCSFGALEVILMGGFISCLVFLSCFLPAA